MWWLNFSLTFGHLLMFGGAFPTNFCSFVLSLITDFLRFSVQRLLIEGHSTDCYLCVYYVLEMNTTTHIRVRSQVQFWGVE